MNENKKNKTFKLNFYRRFVQNPVTTEPQAQNPNNLIVNTMQENNTLLPASVWRWFDWSKVYNVINVFLVLNPGCMDWSN